MAMPKEIIFARHGQSEANIVQRGDDHGLSPETALKIFARPDWKHRLSDKGVEQAKQARVWIDRELGGLATFDALYVSPFYRTRETAAHMGGLDLHGWTIDDRIVERSWGVYGKVPRAEQRSQFPLTAKEKIDNPWYTRLDGGESMPDVYARFRDFQGTLHREQEGKRVFVVSHGDFINAARYGIERMTPEDWEKLDSDPNYTLRNCMLLHYSRVNPDNPDDIREKITWRRYINPVDPTTSPDDGRWVQMPERQRYSGQDLLDHAAVSGRLLEGR